MEPEGGDPADVVCVSSDDEIAPPKSVGQTVLNASQRPPVDSKLHREAVKAWKQKRKVSGEDFR